MKRKSLLFIVLIITLALVFSSCARFTVKEAKEAAEQITATITYKEVATKSDFQRMNNAYSDPPREVPLEEDDYYLVKFSCTFNNNAAKNISFISFKPYSDGVVNISDEAIDIFPTYYIEPNSSESFDAYIYIDKSLDSEEKINEKLSGMTFDFEADYSKDEFENPLKISFKGEYKAS